MIGRLLLLGCALLLAAPAGAILNDTGNGNTSAPPAGDDPGWLNVGRIGALNGVYLGDGWVLTASHVGTGSGLFLADGVGYPIVAATFQLIPHDASNDADLAVMRVHPAPDHLPLLEIRATSPGLDTKVTLIGRGHNQGAASSWGPGGWEWATTFSKRWGTNLIGGIVPGGGPLPVASLLVANGNKVTQSLVTEFTENAPPPQSPYEGQATVGDSGSGLFVETFDGSGVWELAGIGWAITTLTNQPASTSIYTNDTLWADLSAYRDKILAIVRPCADGQDNDGDTLIDYPDDPECLSAADESEEPQCSDGVDNDFDGDTDVGADADCTSAADLLEAPDFDGDFVVDEEDDCLEVPNADQRDTNLDGYGNICDPDFTNDGVVGGPDYGVLSAAYGSSSGEPAYSADVDTDGDGVIGGPDYGVLSIFYGQPPGPSGLSCAGSVPCP
jgi:hypothetical protein